MSALRRLGHRLLGTFRRAPDEADLRTELDAYLQMQIDENLRRGMTPEEARRRALVEFGGMDAATEAWRDERGLPALEQLGQDVRYGWRMLRKTRGATLAALMAFALGLGVNTAMYSILEVVLFRPLLVPDLDRLVVLPSAVQGVSRGMNSVAPADLLEMRAQSRSLESLSAVAWWDANLTGTGEPEHVRAFRVSPSFFDAMRASARLGRGFLPGEDTPGRERVAVLGHALWQRRFAGDPSVVGRRVRLNDRDYDVVGVMPPDMRFPAEAELWVPLALSAGEWDDRRNFYLTAVARLRDGVSLGQAGAEIDTISRRIAAGHPETHRDRTVGVALLRDYISGDLMRGFSLLMLGVAAFVLVIACANVANLQFARVASRARELAVRAALGASRWRLARLLVAEGLLLALMGAAVSVLFSTWTVDLIKASMPVEVQIHLPGWQRMSVSPRALLYTLSLAVVSGLLAGLAGAWVGARGELVEALRDGARGTPAARHRLKGALVVCQLVLALVLLAGAGLMIRGFRIVADPLPRAEAENVLTLRLSLPAARYPGGADRAAFVERALQGLRALPVVESVALSNTVPYSGHGGSTSILVEGRTVTPGVKESARYQPTTSGLFATLRIPLIRGRDFADGDTAAAPRVAIVNEAFARQFFPDADPIGRRVRVGADGDDGPWLLVVGVTGDVLQDWVDRAPLPTVFRPFVQAPLASFYIAARTRMAPLSALADVRSALRAIDPDQPIEDPMTLAKMIRDYMVGLAYVAGMMGAFGLIAVWLAVLGIYSVMSHFVIERTREIGIRMALGATAREVVLLIVGRGAWLAGTGLVIGLAAALVAARGMASLIYGVSAHDVPALGGVSLLLLAAALSACAIPAARAARVDPLRCLRSE